MLQLEDMQAGLNRWSASLPDSYSSVAISHANMAKAPEDWKQITDTTQRKKVQNRIAQRTYRNRLKRRIVELEQMNSMMQDRFFPQSDGEESPTRGHSTPVLDAGGQNGIGNSNHEKNQNGSGNIDDDSNVAMNGAGIHASCLDSKTLTNHFGDIDDSFGLSEALQLPTLKTASTDCRISISSPHLDVSGCTTIAPLAPLQAGELDAMLLGSQSFVPSITSCNWPLEREDFFHVSAVNGSSMPFPIQGSIGQPLDQISQLPDGRTTLHIAVEHNRLNVLQMLLERRANIRAQDAYGTTALHIAASQGHQAAVGLLLSACTTQQADAVDLADAMGCTALHHAAEHGHLAVIELLLRARARVGAQNAEDATPLHLAAAGGHEGVAAALLTAATAAAVPSSNNSPAPKNSLLPANPTYNHHRSRSTSSNRSAEGVVGSKAAADLVNTPDASGATPLHRAAESGRGGHLISLLLDAGACVNVADSAGWTALHLAGRGGHEAVVALLLQSGAEVDCRIDGSRRGSEGEEGGEGAEAGVGAPVRGLLSRAETSQIAGLSTSSGVAVATMQAVGVGGAF